MNDPGQYPHRRRNPLTGEWVLVSAHRTRRPWSGQEEPPAAVKPPRYDPDCYLCPGNSRAGGTRNPAYKSTFVFTNDYPALLPAAGRHPNTLGDELRRWQPTRGTSRVICYSPHHDLTLPELPPEQISTVVYLWRDQLMELEQTYRWVQIFENKGEMMGASNSHPHGQIWAGDFLPTEVEKEDRHQQDYFTRHGRPLLLDYLRQEQKEGTRLVFSNDFWTALVPWWAVWPFELLILPNQPLSSLGRINAGQVTQLADLLKKVLTKYDRLFDVSFPYSMGWHGAPGGCEQQRHWTLHAHIYPPLLRSARIRKFMVGYEMLAEPQRDLTPEEAAARLRELKND